MSYNRVSNPWTHNDVIRVIVSGRVSTGDLLNKEDEHPNPDTANRALTIAC